MQFLSRYPKLCNLRKLQPALPLRHTLHQAVQAARPAELNGSNLMMMTQTTKVDSSVPHRGKRKTRGLSNTTEEAKTCFQTAYELKRKLFTNWIIYNWSIQKLSFNSKVFDCAGFTAGHYLKLLRPTLIQPDPWIGILIQLFKTVYSVQGHLAKQFFHLLLLLMTALLLLHLTLHDRNLHPRLGRPPRNSKPPTPLNKSVTQKKHSSSTIPSN